jgi:nanoRNase/pAp phosphatase (c-di-AMP/oligoRNAs hydrolase)
MPARDPGKPVVETAEGAREVRAQDPGTPGVRTIMTIAQGLGEVLAAHRGERHIVVLQDFPDPDALASAYAHQLISAGYDIQADVVYAEQISHVQNVALVRLTGMNVIRWNPAADLRKYQAAVYVDNQGTTAVRLVDALEKAGVPALMVIDHHEMQERLQPQFSDIRRVGATATLYAEYLAQGLLPMDKGRRDHVLVATALMHGLLTDTHGLIRASADDFTAAAFLSRFRDVDLLEQIMSQARSKQAMETIQRALANRMIVDNFSISGIGYIRMEDRDAIPQAADFLLTEENIHTAIVYGIIQGDEASAERLVGSLRTTKLTLDPDDFIKSGFGKDAAGRYIGGGKALAGGFEVPIGFLAGNGSDEYKDLKWQVFDSQVKRRVLAKIGAGSTR